MANNHESCIFCGIVDKRIKANIVFESDYVVAFHDINKAADLHLLIIPKIHFDSLNEVHSDSSAILAEMLLTAKDLAAKFNVNDSGFRLVMNTGKNAGQSVFHVHMHLLGGRLFSWPPG